MRDVLCMGAEVIGIADPLRFGRLEDPHCRYVAQSVVDGIAAYGNAIGVPNLGGDVYVDESFDDNVLVNVVALGLVKETRDHPLVRAGERDRLRYRARRQGDGSQRLRRRVVLVANARRCRCRSEQGRRPSARSVPQERDHARVVSRVRRTAPARDRGRLQRPRCRRLRRLQCGVVRGRRGRSGGGARPRPGLASRSAAGGDRHRRDPRAPVLDRAAVVHAAAAGDLQRRVLAAADFARGGARRSWAKSSRVRATSRGIAAKS